MKYFFAVWISAVFFVCGAIESRAELITNGNFENGLDGWVSYGVTVDGGEAVLSDTDDWYSYLSQEVFLDPGAFTLEFDFLNLISPEEPDNAFPDVVFVSLFYSSEEYLLDLYAPSLFSDGYYNGHVTDSTVKIDWTHYSVTFKGFDIPVVLDFALYGKNYIPGDSEFRVDNIAINSAPVPEPSTLMLMGAGIVGLAGASRKKMRKALKRHNG